MAISHLCLWPGTIAGGSTEDSHDFIFLFISNRLYSPWGEGWWNEAGDGELIMAPYMAELVNTELSPG